MRRGRNYLLLVGTTLFWALNLFLGQAVIGRIDAVQLVWVRWLIAVPPLVLLALLVDGPQWRAALRDWPRQLIATALGVVAYPLLAYEALRYTTALDVAIVGALNPAVLALAATLVARERVSLRLVLGLAVSLLGVLVVVTRGRLLELFAVRPNLGELLMLGAVVCWTAYSLVGRRSAAPPTTSTAFQAVLCSIALAPLSFVGGRTIDLDATSWWYVVAIAVLASALAFAFWNIAVRELGGAASAVFLNLIPVFTALIGLVLGATVEGAQLLGGALVLAGVTLTAVRLGRRRRPRPAAAATGPGPVAGDAGRPGDGRPPAAG